MEPFLKEGQTVIAFGKATIGDVIVFKEENTSSIFIKRIISEFEGKYVVKGDNSERRISVPRENVLGKVLLKF